MDMSIQRIVPFLMLCTLGGIEAWLAPPFSLHQLNHRSRVVLHSDLQLSRHLPADIDSSPISQSIKSASRKPKPKGSKLQSWRIFGVEVHPDDLSLDVAQERCSSDPQQLFLHPSVQTALTQRLKTSDYSNVRVIRRSLDARMKRRADGSVGPRFVYVIDLETRVKLKAQPGRMEKLDPAKNSRQLQPRLSTSLDSSPVSNKRVIVVGAGPAGLFAALHLAQQGIHPIVLERGQAVERRGKDIGALMHRRSLDAESNFCFGEGGAGTWSDGKLTTRIGRNSESVRRVLETLVEFGAPSSILLDGAPHLGTDNLVRLLRNMRAYLTDLGGEIMFGTRMTDLIIENQTVVGVEYVQTISHPKRESKSMKGRLLGDAVILATGHSARDVYERLHEVGVQLEPKGFAVGFRVEHPQRLINKIQYGTEWGPTVITGKVTTDSANKDYFPTETKHEGVLPVPSYRLATDEAFDGERNRGVYSFCMCPGGQIVPASTDPDEVCVNGMSFSRRDSQWANSALVVTVDPDDTILEEYKKAHGVLAGIAFQREMERRASALGGGNLTVPVQRVTDFLEGKVSRSAPASSYRLGVKPAACHEIYPEPLTASLRHALVTQFNQKMPGYVCDDALLHAVETRTSSPVRIVRNESDLKAFGIDNLFPAGEGAGFAGGIVSAAVDGMVVAQAVTDSLCGRTMTPNLNQVSKADNFY